MIGVLHPDYLLMALPAIILLIVILKIDFLRAKDDDFRRMKRRKTKVMVMITRIIIIVCLFAALAMPYAELDVKEQGPPKLTVVVDQSSSMELYDLDIDSIIDELRKDVPVNVAYVGREYASNIGEGILSNMDEQSNVLLISDGHNNKGISLADVMLEAADLNTTISTLELDAVHEDSAVLILGDDKTFSEVDYEFEVRLSKTSAQAINLMVSLDEKIIFDEITEESSLRFKQKLGQGNHKITARIKDDDYFEENNVFYKSVDVIPKPKILLVTERNDPLEKLVDELYVYERVSSIPDNLDPYYAVLLNDIPADKIDSHVLQLTEYLMDGNGIFSIGGFNSYDRGGYKNSLSETIFPVRVGSAEKRRGDSNIVLVIDISGASAIMYEGKLVTPLDITKALAIEVLGTLNKANRVGVVAFNDKSYKVTDIMPLYENAGASDKISRLKGGGQSYFYEGLRGAYELLKTRKGDRNVILLTDGLAYKDIQDRTASVVDSMRALGIKTYVVGVGTYVEHGFLQELALRGDGIYFAADDANKLAILFGEPEEIKEGDDFSLFVLNPNHFIARNYVPTALMTGYNEVVPKPAARSLLTTQAGTPALTVWNYGVGRVASLNVFTGGNLGLLLDEDNSIVVSRTINWLIADPQRKEQYTVSVGDGFVGDSFRIRVRSEKRPQAEGFEFHKVESKRYESEPFSVEDPGFRSVLNTTFAVNSPREHRFVGFSKTLEGLVETTGGKVFKDIEDISPFVTKASKVRELRKVIVTWPLIALAVLVFIFEVWLRKRQENKS